jgi:hypothetical protein
VTLHEVSHSGPRRRGSGANLFLMRRLNILVLTTSFLLFSCMAQAQPGDWQNVENLPSGTSISIKLRVRFRCLFQSATDEELICERTQRVWILSNSSEIKVNRKRIREVRLEHSDSTNALVGAAVVGGGAAIAEAARVDGDAKTRTIAALFAGSLFGLLGGVIGRDFPILHGKIIYKQ